MELIYSCPEAKHHFRESVGTAFPPWVLVAMTCLFVSLPPGVSTSQTQQAYTSQVLQPEEALYLRKKKKRPILHDPYIRFSALLYRRPIREDQKAILASMDNTDLDHATLLWKSQLFNTAPLSKMTLH